MVKMLKKIVVNKPLNKEDETKINALLKTYETGTIEFYSSFSELHGQNLEITTIITLLQFSHSHSYLLSPNSLITFNLACPHLAQGSPKNIDTLIILSKLHLYLQFLK